MHRLELGQPPVVVGLVGAALVDGLAGAVWVPGGTPRLVFEFTIVRGRIAAIDVIADPDRLRRLEVVIDW